MGLVLVVSLLAPAGSIAQGPQLFRIGTGGRAGVYYPIGKLIAQGLTGAPAQAAATAGSGEAGIAGCIGVAQSSGGSVANVQALTADEIEAGLVQADVAAWAVNGQGVFAGNDKVGNVRAVASLYAEKFQLVVRRDAGIGGIPDCRGRRISIDEIGSGTLAVMRIVLAAYGMSETDLLPVYLKPDLIGDKLARGDLQGFAIMAGVPAAAVQRACAMGFTLVPIDPPVAGRIHARHPHLVAGEIPADVYPGVPRTPTVQVHALLVVRAGAAEDLIYQVTAALWSRRTAALLHAGHPQGRSITLETALDGLTIPLHPGAARFYQQRGMAAATKPGQ